jgi:hydrogenase-4 membrane subunit HyfE
MTTGSNLLAFLGLVVTLLIVWRQSWPARLRLFVAQSLLLAALASTIGVLAQRRGLLLVAAVFVVVKAWVIPRVLARIA